MTNFIKDINQEYTQVLMTTDVDGNYRGVYTYGNERISVEDLGKVEGKPNNPLYYLHDALGCTVAITNMNTGVIDSNRFGPYGEPLDPVAKNARLTNSPYGFTGEAHDIEARLVYLRARYYEPGIMQFLQQDTYLGEIEDPLTRNLYMYAKGNPLRYVDPSGHNSLHVSDGGGSGNQQSTDSIVNPFTNESIFSTDIIKIGKKDTFKDNRVSWLQSYLINLKKKDYDSGSSNGHFDENTKKAVNNFNNQNSLYNVGSWNGVVDRQTWNALNSAVAKIHGNRYNRIYGERYQTENKLTNPIESIVKGTGKNNNSPSTTPISSIAKDTGDVREIVFPDEVQGEINGESILLRPNEKWGIPGRGLYSGKEPINSDGRYLVAVGPKILDPNYPDNGKIWSQDFESFNREIDIILKEKTTGEIITLEAYVYDIKAHTYNKYPDGQSNDKLGNGSFDIENGLIQTGIAYPKSWNAGQNLALSRYHADSSVIEFTGDIKGIFDPTKYKLVKIRVYK